MKQTLIMFLSFVFLLREAGYTETTVSKYSAETYERNAISNPAKLSAASRRSPEDA